MDVSIVRWPEEADRLPQLVELQVPRLVMVEDGAPPPSGDCRQDWIRVPASDDDVQARLATLLARTRSHHVARPELDDSGVLRVGERWVALPPVEARLAAALVDRFGAVVDTGRLFRAGWPDGERQRNALDVRVMRLRRRIAPLGLAITTVRRRGYLMELRDAGSGAVQEDVASS